MVEKKEDIYILAIESSCDDTSAAVMRGDVVLSNVTASQAVHEQYGGVVPELASRAHELNIVPVVDAALKRASVTKEQLSAIAFTRGPGLMGSLLVGVSFAKGLELTDRWESGVEERNGTMIRFRVDEEIFGEFTENGFTNNLSHKRGVVSMARSSENDSASSQFFICNADATSLDEKYAAFGYVVYGMDTGDIISALATDDSDKPIQKVTIEKVSFVSKK